MTVKTTRLITAITLVACSTSSAPEPAMTYFANFRAADRKLVGAHCLPNALWIDHSLPRGRDIRQTYLCRWPSGVFPLTVTGYSRTGDERVCSLQLGPADVERPMITPALTLIFDLFDDPMLARRLKLAIGDLDPRRSYRIELTEAGIHFELDQSQVVAPPTIELSIDGCGHVADDHTTRSEGPVMTFPKPE